MSEGAHARFPPGGLGPARPARSTAPSRGPGSLLGTLCQGLETQACPWEPPHAARAPEAGTSPASHLSQAPPVSPGAEPPWEKGFWDRGAQQGKRSRPPTLTPLLGVWLTGGEGSGPVSSPPWGPAHVLGSQEALCSEVGSCRAVLVPLSRRKGGARGARGAGHGKTHLPWAVRQHAPWAGVEAEARGRPGYSCTHTPGGICGKWRGSAYEPATVCTILQRVPRPSEGCSDIKQGGHFDLGGCWER